MVITRTVAAVAAAAAIVLATPLAASATAPTRYANCAAVHKHWSGGIALPGTKWNLIHHVHGPTTREHIQGKVDFSKALYDANKRLDADKDGIACELNERP